ncbi:MAG: hypothetical protein R3E21_13610 [Caenibius sp.]
MHYRSRLALALSLVPLLSACGESGSSGAVPVKSASAHPVPATKPPPPPPAKFRTATRQAMPGLEGVIGNTATALTRQFGTPRLDVREGDVRKLQFSGTACVLDIFLYPPRPQAEPEATYVDARRASDGRDVDRAACVAALRRP